MILAAVVLLVAGGTAVPGGAERLAHGAVFQKFRKGPWSGYLLAVDLERARVGLLRPGAVARRATVPRMVERQGALAGVNGDFFQIADKAHGLPPTGASNGPEVEHGRPLKAAVPDGQRFGPTPPAGASTQHVIGVTDRGVGKVGRLRLDGTVTTPHGVIPLRGLNQFALPEDGVGAFTSEWGTASRARSVCGSDERRGAPCAGRTAEVTVRDGVVTASEAEVGAGRVPADTVVLVGREQGAEKLAELRVGDRVDTRYRFDGPALDFAVGGVPILRGGRPVPGLDHARRAPRTAAALTKGGHRMLLVVVDGRGSGPGITTRGMAKLLRRLHARNGVQLDGGGSSTLVTSTGGTPVTRNTPSDGVERPVANGIGVFS